MKGPKTLGFRALLLLAGEVGKQLQYNTDITYMPHFRQEGGTQKGTRLSTRLGFSVHCLSAPSIPRWAPGASKSKGAWQLGDQSQVLLPKRSSGFLEKLSVQSARHTAEAHRGMVQAERSVARAVAIPRRQLGMRHRGNCRRGGHGYLGKRDLLVIWQFALRVTVF